MYTFLGKFVLGLIIYFYFWFNFCIGKVVNVLAENLMSGKFMSRAPFNVSIMFSHGNDIEY